MAEAIASRLLELGIYAPEEVLVSEPNADRQALWRDRYGVAVTTDNAAIANTAAVVLLAIKPQILPLVSAALEGVAMPPDGQAIVSILAGTPLKALEAAFPDRAVIRVMPNTPATVGAGISALAWGSQVNDSDREAARRILGAVGEVVEVSETQLDAVTGLSGSGPGFVALIVEALTDGGVAVGLARPIAAKLAVQTVLGTGQLLSETGIHPAELKDRVTSPGGTTIAGIAALEAAGLRSALISAVQAATARSRELGQG
jgi:pyrroline-5-carboxylate reductase